MCGEPLAVLQSLNSGPRKPPAMTKRRSTSKSAPRPAPAKAGGTRRLLRPIPMAALLIIPIVSLILAVLIGPSRKNTPPNVLLITFDTTRAGYLGCYGEPEARTPNIDRLAHEGALFTHCATCTSMTLPSHSSIMTGNYPFVHRVRRNATDKLTDANSVLAESFQSADYATGAVLAAIVLNKQFGLDQGFDSYLDLSPRPGMDARRVYRNGDEVCDEAITLLDNTAGQHFFMWVHFYDPHYPYEPRTRQTNSPEEAYADEITFMDMQVGRLLTELARLGVDDNTLVVLVGDHGEGLGDHGEWQHGFFVYESTLHVPLVFWWPDRLEAGRVVDQQVRTIDIAPTILDLVGLTPLSDIQGRSLTPLLAGHELAEKLPAYAEALEGNSQLSLAPLRSITVGEWKYMLAPQPALFDLKTDPAEQVNLIDQQPEIADELHDELRQLIADAPAPLEGGDTFVQLTAEEVERLESLGYVASVASPEEPTTELERLEPVGPDPRTHTDTIRAYEEARMALKDQRFDVAEEQLRQVIDALPEASAPPGELAQTLEDQGRIAEAMEVCERGLELHPNDTQLNLRYGQMLIRFRRYDEAVEHLQTALRTSPDSVMALYNRGVALTALRQFDEAREHFEAALKLTPNDIRLWQGLAVQYVRQGRYAEAADALSHALQISPNHPRLKQEYQKVVEAMNRHGSGQP